MSANPPILVSAGDSTVIEAFAAQSGIPSHQLINAVIAAFAEHLRHQGTITLPIRIGLPAPHCTSCPFAQAGSHLPLEAPHNLIRAPFPAR